jgi:dCMP deaminase
MRPDWDEYFIGIAEAVATRGDCTRSKVGAVLVEDRTHRILSTGYNGVEPGKLGCLSGSCPRGLLSYDEVPPGGSYSNCIALHAELNCLRYAERYYPQDSVRKVESVNGYSFWVAFDIVDFSGCTMYVTRKPCGDCEHELRVAGVRRAVWPGDEGFGRIRSLDLTPPKM